MHHASLSGETRLDPLLAITLLASLGGLLVLLLFGAELGALSKLGAAPLYLLVMPASLLLARWLQLRGQRRSARRLAPRLPARRQARRRQLQPPRRRLRAVLAAALAAPLPR